MRLSNSQFVTSAAHIADALRLAIFRGELRPGQALVQEEIAKRFGVSRIPVRDAMNQLQAEGLLRILPGKGSFVADPSPEELLEIYEVRAVLELEALRLALPHHSAQTLERAERLLRQLDLETDPARWGELDLEFHSALYAPARKEKLFELINSLRATSNRFYYLQTQSNQHLKQCQTAHWQILKACQARKLRDAAGLLQQHLLDAGSVVATAARDMGEQAGRRNPTLR
jgi:DNA-binding GntR family transcriptional regulator